MRRFAVIGAESSVGTVVLKHLTPVGSVTEHSIDDADLPNICRKATDIVCCGDAARSSWDDDFGDFERDRSLVQRIRETARQTACRFVYVSSDAVFDGPWVFHDDDTPQSGRDAISRQLKSLEQNVLSDSGNLVIRTNALNDGDSGFLRELRNSLSGSGRVSVRSDVYATPLAADRMAAMLAVVLNTDASGVVHLAGAERLSAWHLALGLAAAQCLDRSRLHPVTDSAPREQSLRCSRALQEFHLRMPTFSQTLDDLTGSSQMPQRQAA